MLPATPMVRRLAAEPRAGDFALPAPIDAGRIAAPSNPLARLGTLPAPPAPNHGGPIGQSITTRDGASALPRDPHGQRLAAELRARRIRSPGTHRRLGVSPPLRTHSPDLEHFLLHRHRTMEERLADPSPLGVKPPRSPETPMVSVLPLNHAPGDFALPAPINTGAETMGWVLSLPAEKETVRKSRPFLPRNRTRTN